MTREMYLRVTQFMKNQMTFKQFLLVSSAIQSDRWWLWMYR